MRIIKKNLIALGILMACTSIQANAGGFTIGSQPQEEHASGIIVKFKDQNARVDILSRFDGRSTLPNKGMPLATLSTMGGSGSLTYNRPMSLGSDVISLAPGTSIAAAEEIANRLAGQPDVEFAVVDRIAHIMQTPNDSRYPEQWHYHSVITAGASPNYGLNLPPAWDITTGSSSVVVAVLDTGITVHEDIDSSRILPGYDFLTSLSQANDGDGRDSNPSDPGDCTNSASCSSSWHGTHVAGTIGANSNNALGVSGVSWGSRILPVRVLGVGGGAYSDIIDGMVWASGGTVPGVPANTTPAKVLNLSLGGANPCDSAMQTAVNAAMANGAVVVVSAGNSNANVSGYSPASCTGVITVAATSQTGQRAYYSNYGTGVEIAAPGGDYNVDTTVLSTLNSGITSPGSSTYAGYQGTSMAAPHVSGLVSLMLSVNPALTASQILTHIQQNATPFPAGGSCTTSNCGSGIANAGTTLAAINTAPIEDTQPDPFGWPTVTNVALNTWITSAPITLTGFDTPAPFSVDNGYLILNCGGGGWLPFPRVPTSEAESSSGIVAPGTRVCVKHKSAASGSTSVISSVTIGGVVGTFTSTTKATSTTPPIWRWFPR